MEPNPTARDIEISRRMIDAGVATLRMAVHPEKLMGELSIHERAQVVVRIYKAMQEARENGTA